MQMQIKTKMFTFSCAPRFSRIKLIVVNKITERLYHVQQSTRLRAPQRMSERENERRGEDANTVERTNAQISNNWKGVFR